MGRINSKQKGNAGEREFASFLRSTLGILARRGVQYSGTPDSPDVVTNTNIHFEVKRVEALNLSQAFAQANAECGEKIPCVAHRRNRSPWLLTIRAEDAMEFAKAMYQARFEVAELEEMEV